MATQERLVRDPETTILTGLGKSQRHRLEEKGLFPERKRLSPMGRATGYLLSELNAWIVSRLALGDYVDSFHEPHGTQRPWPWIQLSSPLNTLKLRVGLLLRTILISYASIVQIVQLYKLSDWLYYVFTKHSITK